MYIPIMRVRTPERKEKRNLNQQLPCMCVSRGHDYGLTVWLQSTLKSIYILQVDFFFFLFRTTQNTHCLVIMDGVKKFLDRFPVVFGHAAAAARAINCVFEHAAAAVGAWVFGFSNTQDTKKKPVEIKGCPLNNINIYLYTYTLHTHTYTHAHAHTHA